ncbi:MAG: LytTR family DNA-binding domain-containing protein [Bacilli bacterium]|nr:LytTR family DNA-binding domain-containing protein [Bacilli bacterium]
MKIKINIDKDIDETSVIINAAKMSKDIDNLVSIINNASDKNLVGYKDELVYFIPRDEVVRFYIYDKMVKLETMTVTYNVKSTLRGLEETLERNFIRISNSEIVNLRYISHVDLSDRGTIKIVFKNNQYTYASRRNVGLIKERLGL